MLWYFYDWLMTVYILHNKPNSTCYGTVMNISVWIPIGTYYLLPIISDWIPKGTCYWRSRIEFQKVLVTDYIGLNSKRYLLPTILDWIPKGTCYWLSWTEFQKIPVTVYLGLNSIRFLLLTISDWISKGTGVTDYIGLNVKRYYFCRSHFTIISKGTFSVGQISP